MRGRKKLRKRGQTRKEIEERRKGIKILEKDGRENEEDESK